MSGATEGVKGGGWDPNPGSLAGWMPLIPTLPCQVRSACCGFGSFWDFLSFICRGGHEGCPQRLKDTHCHTARGRWPRAECEGLFPGSEDLVVRDRSLLGLVLPRLLFPFVIVRFLPVLPDEAQAPPPPGRPP